MRIIRHVLQKEGWHLAEAGLPIQVGVKSGATPFSGKHLHRTMAEYFVLLAGELRLQVEKETVEVQKGDLVVVEPGEAHEVFHASPDTLLLLLMPPPVPGDKVELEE
jgi:quercetin dioxygenase-like cupin family protein